MRFDSKIINLHCLAILSPISLSEHHSNILLQLIFLCFLNDTMKIIKKDTKSSYNESTGDKKKFEPYRWFD